MESFKEDLRKWTREEIESAPGKLAAQIVFNQLIRNKFFMWFVGNVEGNQLYTVTLSNKEKALFLVLKLYFFGNNFKIDWKKAFGLLILSEQFHL